VVIDEPLISRYGGTVAAPAMRRIADQALRYMGVAPLKEKPKRQKPTRADRADTMAAQDAHSDPADVSDVPLTDDVTPNLGPNQVITPNLLGMSMVQAMESLAAHDLRPLFMGTGFAAEQAPPPGDPIERGEFIQVNFTTSGLEPAVQRPPQESSDADRS